MSEANNNSFEKKIQFVASSESQDSIASFSEQHKDKEIDWHKLAHKLREHNRKLLKKVFQLEQEILESNKALEEHIKRSCSNDIYVAKQAETINQYQEEVAKLAQKINTYQQEKSSQQFIIDNLQHRLESSEEHIAKLEKKCTNLQKDKDLQNQELLAKKQQIEELNTRFNRQQQHLLQYKFNKNSAVVNQPIKAWSANTVENKPVKTAVSPKINSTDWAVPTTAKKQAKINSIAAVQLPTFPRQAQEQ